MFEAKVFWIIGLKGCVAAARPTGQTPSGPVTSGAGLIPTVVVPVTLFPKSINFVL